MDRSAGIVQVACRAGCQSVARDRSVEALGREQLYVRDGLDRFDRKGVISEDDARTTGPKKVVFGSLVRLT
jgi:3-hydroxyacyl-CoA dehydrogenase